MLTSTVCIDQEGTTHHQSGLSPACSLAQFDEWMNLNNVW